MVTLKNGTACLTFDEAVISPGIGESCQPDACALVLQSVAIELSDRVRITAWVTNGSSTIVVICEI